VSQERAFSREFNLGRDNLIVVAGRLIATRHPTSIRERTVISSPTSTWRGLARVG